MPVCLLVPIVTITNFCSRIADTPEIRLQLGKSLTSGSIREGIDVYFDCVIKANPAVNKVDWKHNDGPLNHNASHGVIISNQSLVLQSVGRNSSGTYSCIAHNSEGSGKSTPFFLNVMCTC
ncbi:hypothetical protein PR048_023400 [Dryococelus australis]|uniref:Ig-like domain-containing protein n=1 Tax=Dryococelus australis TaxID=614101 RepID=A0ABQ9GU07_9NEOP|nr:hypothetical protein PR048_023400 [Dryococelus australis]